MSLEEKKYDIEANNDWAKNVKGEHLFIDEVQSGRKGYFCIGCDKQMEAVIQKKNPKHRSFFRHIAVDISKDDTQCTFSNRKYREKLATDILQRLKRIKVPSLYKYPPKGEEGDPMLIEKATYIPANKVKSQLTFYEDNEGAIKYGKNPKVEDRYLLIRPDVTFFDANNNPILLIELVITHKVKEEKKIKLRRLGIDTVSIMVPKSSAQEIEDNFKTTKRVKWEYNGIEANTKYIRVSSGTSEGVLEFDEYQRRIFEESVTCRKARLNNTVRTIRKCLQSEPYRRAELDFESEISRIKAATKKAKQELARLEERARRDVFKGFRKEFDTIERKQTEITKQITKEENRYRDLEERYFKKRKELQEKEFEINNLLRENEKYQKPDSETTERYRREEKYHQEKNEGIDKQIRDLQSRTEALQGLQNGQASIDTGRVRKTKSSIEEQIVAIEDDTATRKAELRSRFEELREQTSQRINQRDISGEDELTKRIKTVLELGRILDGYSEKQRTYQRYRKALELARRGT